MVTIKRNYLCITGVLEGRERDKGAENLFKEIVNENFPNTGKVKHASS